MSTNWLVINIVWELFAECGGGDWGDPPPEGFLPSSKEWPPVWMRAELVLLVVTSPFVSHRKASCQPW